jgi:hypothetical protein
MMNLNCICQTSCKYSLPDEKAALLGHLDCLKMNASYLETSQVCQYAAMGGYLEIIKWAKEKGYNFQEYDLLKVSLSNQRLNVADWLLKNYSTMDDTVYECVLLDCNKKCVEWVIKNKYIKTEDVDVEWILFIKIKILKVLIKKNIINMSFLYKYMNSYTPYVGVGHNNENFMFSYTFSKYRCVTFIFEI